jgi:hypothetical protein
VADLPRFDLGQAGLVLTSSPLHGDPGQLTTAQNIEFKRVQGLGGIGSRAPLAPFNLTPMLMADAVTPGRILSATAVPLPSPVDNLAFPAILFLDADGGFCIDYGSGFSCFMPTGALAPRNGGQAVALGGMFYYTTSGGDVAQLNPKTKTTTTVIATTGDTVSLLVLGTKLYACVVDNGFDAGSWLPNFAGGSFTNAPAIAVTGHVVEYDPGTTLTRTIGEAFGLAGGMLDNRLHIGGTNHGSSATATTLSYAPSCLATDGTLLYVNVAEFIHRAASQASMSLTYGVQSFLHINPTPGTNWSYDSTILGYTGNTLFNGPTGGPADYFYQKRAFQWVKGYGVGAKEYRAGWQHAADTNQYTVPPGSSAWVFLENVTDGNLITPVEYPNPGVQYFSLPILYGTILLFAYASSNYPQTTASQVQIYKTAPGSQDVSAATVDLDVTATYGANVLPGQPFLSLDGTALYWPMYVPGGGSSGFLLKRDVLGVWTQALTGLNLSAFALNGDLVR